MADKGCETKQFDSVCRHMFDRIEEHSEKRHEEAMKLIREMNKLLRGNGDIGLVTRVDRLEQANAWGKRIAFVVIGIGLARFFAGVFG